MTSTDKDLSLTPLKGNSGKAYMGTYPNGDRVFVKMNTTPILGSSCQGTDCAPAPVG